MFNLFVIFLICYNNNKKNGEKLRSIKKELYKTTLLGLIFAFLVLIIIFLFIKNMVINHKLETARFETKTIVYYRHYLSLIAPKIHPEDYNLSPFVLTPAYVTSQVAKMLRKDNFYLKQASDDYRDIANKPIPVEIEAINFFRHHKNKNEFFGIFKDKGNDYFFYARKLIIEKSCLKCHGIPFKDVPAELYYKIIKIYGNKAFGYKEGDVRGVLSVKIPYQNIENEIFKNFFIIIGIGFLFFIVGLLIFLRLNEKIQDDINKILAHFKFTKIGRYPLVKDKMNFIEFKELKNQINKTFLKLKKYQGYVYHKYYFDPLTDLPNRNKFIEFIQKNKYQLALINADKFKEINFYFGNEIGDELIINIAKRLKELRKNFNFKLFHIDIDEFALVFKTQFSDIKEFEKVLKDILEILEEPYNIRSNEIIIRFRIGASFYKKDFHKADVALDMAKDLKKDIVFGKDVNDLEKYKRHLECLKKLKWALNHNQIIPFYQPIVDRDKQIIKYEVLARFKDQDGNIISPSTFLEVAKKSRYYLDITKIIIEKAINKVLEKDIAVSINLTLEDIEDDKLREFIFQKLSLLKDTSKITFEIVESEDVRDNVIVKEFIKDARKAGAFIYIDDFGSGYSNFDYVIKLKPDGIKIDGSLIKNILENKEAQAIVKTIIIFSKEIGIKTIAEYVENEEIFEYLKNLGIDYFQGYYFSPPKEDI
jgi:diguanylate cyclase (GGDEF)-like protein